MKPKLWLAGAASLLAFAGTGFDAAKDFDASRNPAGTWSFGWRSALGGALNLYPKHYTTTWWGGRVAGWSRSGEGPQHGRKCCPFVAVNLSGGPVPNAGLRVPVGGMWFHPGPDGEFSVVRWTAPAPGRYSIQARFGAVSEPSVDIHILKNGASLMDESLEGRWVSYDYSLESVVCFANDVVDFVVGYGHDHSHNGDMIGLSVNITPLGEPKR